jgi:hypothetical protein
MLTAVTSRHTSKVPERDPQTKGPLSGRGPDVIVVLLVFVASVIVLLVSIRGRISDTTTFETGDAAANSLLVREAKDLRLTVGNYSRVGFNHPGPALLYVLAAGETTFHDLVPVAGTPFGGQMVGLAVWNSFLLALICRQILRASSRRMAGMALFSVFLALLAKLEPGSFTDSWFPHVYILPFALFLTSIASVQVQPQQGTVVLGFATGVLWNAHVAFIPITVIVIATAAAAVVVQLVRTQASVSKWAKTMVPAIGVWASLQVPLLIELGRRWPSPVKDFVTFGADNPHNSLVAALRFTLSFWPLTSGFLGALWIAVLVVLLLVGWKEHSVARALIGGALSSTAAVLVYAVFGIDDLNFRYVAFFYRSAIALGLAASAVVVTELAGRRWPAITRPQGFALRGVTCVALAAATRSAVRHPAEVTGPVIRLEGEAARLASATDKSGARLHINIEQYGYIWPRLVGLQLAQNRDGAPRTCIATRWHVLFTAEAQCSVSDRKRPDVRVEAELDAAGNPVGLNFVATDLRLQAGDVFVPGAAANSDAALVMKDGWSDIEAGRVWADENVSSLEFTMAPELEANLEFDVEALIGGTQSEVLAEVRVNGVITDTWSFTQTNNRGIRSVGLPATSDGRSVVELRVNSRASALSLGVGPDRRKVGLSLFKVEVRSVGPVTQP